MGRLKAVLFNYHNRREYIIFEDGKYTLLTQIAEPRNGVGGFESDEKDLLGLFVDNQKIYLIWKNKIDELIPSEVKCTNEKQGNGKNIFTIRNNGEILCKIEYIAFLNPDWVLDEDPYEYDFLLHISERILYNEEKMNDFIKDIELSKNMKSYIYIYD